MNKWENVFEAYPAVNEIYVVDGMPFLEAHHAQAHSRSTGKPVEAVKRSQADTAETEAPAPMEPKGKKKGAPAEPKGKKKGAPAEPEDE